MVLKLHLIDKFITAKCSAGNKLAFTGKKKLKRFFFPPLLLKMRHSRTPKVWKAPLIMIYFLQVGQVEIESAAPAH